MERPQHDAEQLKERLAQWRRFTDWEAREEAGRERSLSADLAWLADAIALTRQFDPEWGSVVRVREKAVRLARDRAILATLRDRAA